VICSLKRKKGKDWLNDIADGFSFAYLYDQGVITDNDFIKIPYIINYVPDGLQIIVLSMSIFMMAKEIATTIQAISDSIADITDASTPVVGVSVGLGAGVVTAWDIGNFIMVGLKVLARIAYVIAITIALIEMIETLFEEILPKKREYLGMKYRTMFEKSCSHLNLSFQSSIPELDWIYIPQKDRKGGDDGETGYPTNSGSMYTFGDFIRVMKQKFNADYRIINNTFIFERLDFFEYTGNYQIPDVLQDQSKLLTNVKFNTNEIVSNYNIDFRFDTQDQNTLDDQNGRVFQAITSPINTVNEDLTSLKGLTEISLPMSLAKTKTKLNRVEKVAKTLGGIVDTLTGIFGNGTNFQSQIENRIGCMVISSHFLSVGKIVDMNGSKLHFNQRDRINAKLLFDKYHYINSFAEINGKHNQFWRYPATRVPMSLDEFQSLLENNSGVYNGEEFIIETLKYYPAERYGVIEYRVKRKYTNNLKIEFI